MRWTPFPESAFRYAGSVPTSVLPSPARMIFERTDTGVGLLAGRAWDGRFPFDLLSNGHRMRGPHQAGRPAGTTTADGFAHRFKSSSKGTTDGPCGWCRTTPTN